MNDTTGAIRLNSLWLENEKEILMVVGYEMRGKCREDERGLKVRRQGRVSGI